MSDREVNTLDGDIQPFNKKEYNAIDILRAALKGDEHLTALLLHVKWLNVDIRNTMNRTALIYAAETNAEKIATLLLQHNASVDIQYTGGKTALMYAAGKNADVVTTLLLQHNASVDIEDTGDKTALMYAAEKNADTVTTLLLQHNASVNIQEIEGQTALMYAADNNADKVTTLLLQHNASVDIQQRELGKTALMYAVEKNADKVTALLLQHNASVDIQDTDDGKTALMYAAEKNAENITALLLKHSASVDIQDTRYGKTALMYAAVENADKITALLLQHNASVNVQDQFWGQTALMYAAGYNADEVITLLLQHNASVDIQDTRWGMTALMYATEKGAETSIIILLKHNASIDIKNNKGETVIKQFQQKGPDTIISFQNVITGNHPEFAASNQTKNPFTGKLNWLCFISLLNAELGVIDDIFDKGYQECFSLNIYNGMPYIHFITENGKMDALRLLLNKGLDVNYRSDSTLTPLIIACIRDNIDMVALLIAHKADVDMITSDGKSAVAICFEKGHNNILKMLLHHSNTVDLKTVVVCGCQDILSHVIQKSKDINEPFEKEETALHITAFHGYHECVKCLLDNGAKCDVSDLYGNLPLHFAAQSGNISLMRDILKCSKSVINKTNISGWTPLHIAVRECHVECVEALVQAGASVTVKDDYGMTAGDYALKGRRLYHKDEVEDKDGTRNLMQGTVDDVICKLLLLGQKMEPAKQKYSDELKFIQQVQAMADMNAQ